MYQGVTFRQSLHNTNVFLLKRKPHSSPLKSSFYVKAQEQKQEKPVQPTLTKEQQDEAMIRALEARGRKKSKQLEKQQQQQQEDMKKNDLPPSNRAEWKEGQLFPEGWENMDAGQKLFELWTGERGMLFWMNKIAYGALFVIVGGWVLFRFVGPTLGLYELQSGFEQ
eukprot:TRINITY_DN1099_c1_g1_i1.p2 TRINITY_DN1099_c1_g1~~TRINITY_DN1099_c1_g1_i1.p2  ORF type:complete len:177 (+),score=22.03 TRINITY_DN1099_c1_g1_i1:33-533(+)